MTEAAGVGSGFDYVVVGGGSAGCVLAGRLSEDPSVSVALIEAGPRDRRPEIRVPAAFSKLLKSAYDWDFTTAGQPGLDGRALYWPRGRTLGGCSSINAMLWIRGHRDDYDTWAEAAGGDWSHDAFVKYFRRAERWGGAPGASVVHGTEGPQWVSPARDLNPTTYAFLDACRDAGLRELYELNSPDHSGFAPAPLSQRRGRRWSAADAYLHPARHRPNLRVFTGVHARRLAFDGSRATGVVAERDGVTRLLRARREVLLSAGAIGSPQLLQRSGIGDPDTLAEAGVEVRVASPDVGRHLQDHLVYAVTMRCSEPVSLTGADSPLNVARYVTTRRGPLTSNLGEALAFLKTRPGLAAPDVELVYAPVPVVAHGLIPPTEHGITLGVVLLQPRSEGRITPGPTETAAPRIDPGYLSDPEDLATLVAGVRRAEELFARESLAQLVAGPLDPYPGVVGDEELARSVRAHAETLCHPVGTCRMGTDDAAVTDPRLRVRGVEGLRVVDASVMPRITRGHTNAPTIALAEKAAEMIREDAADQGVRPGQPGTP